ncbi:MAG: late competence development ComFB family protein [Oscillospiraceae bacterium]|nr:late competence development ComFB family protein [Oscillospiraceae bacterium]
MIEYSFKNYMQDLVEFFLPVFFQEELVKHPDLIITPLLVAKVEAGALNRMPPMYITTKAGEIYSEYKMKAQQYKVDLFVAMSSALEQVRAQEKAQQQANLYK